MNPTGCLDHVGVSYPGFDLCDTLLRRGRSGATTRMEMGYFPFFLFLTLLKLNMIVIVLHLSLTSSTLSLWRDISNCQTWNRQSILMETLMRIHYICYIFISSMFPLNTIHALNVTIDQPAAKYFGQWKKWVQRILFLAREAGGFEFWPNPYHKYQI